MRALRDMPSPSNSLTSLQIFYDSVESHIRGLASLGKSETSYGELLVLVILDKLPIDVQRNLAREHSNSQWILSDLMAAILKEIRVLECGQYNHTSRFQDQVQHSSLILEITSIRNSSKMASTASVSNSVCFAKDTILHIIVMLSQIIRNDLTLSRTIHFVLIVLLATGYLSAHPSFIVGSAKRNITPAFATVKQPLLQKRRVMSRRQRSPHPPVDS